MTYDGFCAVALAGTFVMLAAVTVGWTIDRWSEWRVRNEEHRIWANFQEGELWLARTGSRGTATGQRADPSPRPRVGRLIDNGIREQNREAAWRARAEGENL